MLNQFYANAILHNKPLRLMNGRIGYVKFEIPKENAPGRRHRYVGYYLCELENHKVAIIASWDKFGRCNISKEFDIWGYDEEFEAGGGVYE